MQNPTSLLQSGITLASITLAGLILPSMSPARRVVTFEDRVKAQEAIERVSYSHQIGTTRPFEEVVPRPVLERKVAAYLTRTVALEKLLGGPVTEEMLRAEMNRIESNTRIPARLREIQAALNHDSTLIQECFGRSVLVDRLARLLPGRDQGNDDEGPIGAGAGLLEKPGQFFMPPERSRHKAIWTGNVMLVWGGCGTSTCPGLRYDPVTDLWSQMPWSSLQSDTGGSAIVWTGDVIVVWGAYGAGRYDPVSDTWSAVSSVDAPERRRDPSLVWTGNEVIVWGGTPLLGGGYTNTGGRYDPVADTWAATSLAGAPQARDRHTAVWTGSSMVVWGGITFVSDRFVDLDSGGRYDPASDSWTPTSMVNAPSGRRGHTAIWMGSQMAVWGGSAGVTEASGGLYDPSSDTWTPITTLNGPSQRSEHTAVWTGQEMVVWGGHVDLETGGRYDPQADSWTPTSTVGAPVGRSLHSAVWTGLRMIVWGGSTSQGTTNLGGTYDPVSDTWVLPDDADGDGYTVGAGDCDDGNPAIHPGAAEICNRKDDDCDGVLPSSEIDGDHDLQTPCEGDCDDYDVYNRSGQPERCDGRDNDCDGWLAPWEEDKDGDGWPVGIGGPPVNGCPVFCIDPYKFHCTGDCQDYDPAVHPYAPELCGDGKINDCILLLYRRPGLGWCSPWHSWNEEDCDQDGVTQCQGDCVPYDPSIHPGAVDICDLQDNDCDGYQEEYDYDQDGFKGCAGDCNDHDASIWPAAPEICDGKDNDCDGAAEDVSTDEDGDGFSRCDDCDDLNPAMHPGAIDIPGDPWNQDCVAGTLCDPSAAWSAHGDYVSCVETQCVKMKKLGLLTGRQCDAIVSAAARNQWGGP